jgi:hypothetical protein
LTAYHSNRYWNGYLSALDWFTTLASSAATALLCFVCHI